MKTRTETEQVDEFFSGRSLRPTTTASGLRYLTLTPGIGDAAGRNKTAKVTYKGMFLNGKTFDSGTFEFITGSGGSIAGFDEAVQLMKVGEKALVAFPSGLGYGQRGSGSIPPNTPLAFEIELVSIK